MKTKTIASSLPLLAGIALGAAALFTPFLVANHWILTGTGRYNVDNYLFFFWGKYYTVTGANSIASMMIMYDMGDFPMYAMILIVLGIITGASSILAGRGVVLNIKGRVLKMKLDVNPVWLQAASVAMLLLSYLYMGIAVKGLDTMLLKGNYELTSGPALDFLAGSMFAFIMSMVLTGWKFLKEEDAKSKKTMAVPVDM